ncbi:MAG: hypothetical protein IV086_02940 [Hyphomonadaceae bacterium]|nr:hypothetical protein [Hyphomonadaceae bacterium]
MVALLIFFVVLGWSLLIAGFRRALPIAASVMSGWIAWELSANWIATAVCAVAAMNLVAALSDWMAEHQDWRPTWIAAEVLGAAGFGALSGFMLFGSSGVSGMALVVVMAAFSLIAAATAFRFRVLN